MRRPANTARLGAKARRKVGIARKARLMMMPRRRSTFWLKTATAMLATAMPSVLALTANPIAAGATL
jgi:hypothetical protein